MTSGTLGGIVRRIRGMVGAPPGEESTDGQLLRRFAVSREQAAFDALVERHGPLVLGLCRRVLGDLHDAEDAFQATFLVLARRAGALDRRGTVAGWLYKVAYRIALRARSNAARRRERERGVAASPVAEPADAPAHDLRPILDEELRRLPEKYRLPMLLCYLEGKTQEEAAQQLGWAKGTVSGRLARARETLRGRLTRRGLAPSACLLAPTLPAVVPALLRQGTLSAAVPFASGLAVAGTASTLAREVIRNAVFAKLTLLAAGMLAVVAVGTGVLIGRASPAPEEPPAAREVIRIDPVDQHGDSLPAHAVARLGTVRLSEGEGIRTATFSPDGKLVASAGHYHRFEQEALHVWDVATGREIRRLLGVADTLMFSPDSRLLATTDTFGRLRLWNVTTGVSQWMWDVSSEKDSDGHSVRLGAIAFSPDGKTLAVATGDGTIRVRSTATGKETGRIRWQASGLAFSPDGKTLATIDFMGKAVSLWDPATGKRLYTLAHAENVLSLDFSPDSQSLVAQGTGNQVKLWDVGGGEERRTINAPGIGYPIRFTGDGKQVRTFRWIFDLATGEETRPEDARGSSIALSKNARLSATSGYGALHIWDVVAGCEVVTLDRHDGGIQYLIPSADGKTIRTVGQYDRMMHEWSITGKHLGATPRAAWEQFRALSADGKVLATPHCLNNKEYALVEVITGNMAEGGDKYDQIRAMALTPDADLVAGASGGKKRVIRLWRARDGKKLHTLEDKAGGSSRLAFSPDGKTLAAAQTLDRIDLWDAATGKPRPARTWRPQAREQPSDKSLSPAGSRGWWGLIDPKAEPSPAAGLVFSPSGKTLAVTSGHHYIRWASFPPPDAYLVRLYDLITGKELFQLLDQEAAIAFSPDGATLATAGHSDFVVYLWDAATGRQRGRFEGHRGVVTSLAFTADGRRLISGSADCTALIWAVPGK